MFGYVDLVVFIGVLAAVAVMLPSAMNWNRMVFTSQVAQVEAGQLATVTNAALEYEYSYSATLDAPGSSRTVTIPQLIAQGFLPVGTKATDEFGNPITVLFTADGSGNVTGYVVDQGQKIYSNLEAGRLMLDLGDRGGYVPATPIAGQQPNVIYGSGDTWQVGAPPGIAAGSVEVKVEPNAAQEADDSRFLWRVPAPNAAENTMSTPLVMSATEVEGTGCAYTGAIAQNGTGALVSCQSGTWTAVGGGHWRAPVSTFAALPASGNQNGDVRLTLDTDRAFAWNGGSWVALAVNQNGNLHVPGTLTADNNRASIDETPGGYGAQLNLDDDAGNMYAHIQNAPFGSFLTLTSNTNDSISLVSQGQHLALWNNDAAQDVMVVHPDGTWEGARGTFCLPGQGNMAQTYLAPCGNGWGWQPQYNTGWSMVTQDGPNNFNDQPGAAQGSIDMDDSYHRAGGAYPWYSQLSSQVYSDTQQINNLNNEYSSQQGQISTINNNLNQSINTGNCNAAAYASLQSLCTAVVNAGAAQIGEPEQCSGYPSSVPQSCGPVGYYPPTAYIPVDYTYAQLVVATATAGIGAPSYGCSSHSYTGNITLSATVGGSQVASESGQYSIGRSTMNPNHMYFPFSITFVVPAGQSGQIQLAGGINGLGCGIFSYSLYRL